MTAPTDRDLLTAYIADHSESAFANLVERHLSHVYSTALRIVVDHHLAEDVTQATFVALAKNARRLAGRDVLSGWLHLTTRNVAAKLVRGQERRRGREREAIAMSIPPLEENDIWNRLAPHLDAALAQLNENDRDALTLRYFERKTAAQIGQQLGLSADAAQKRVTRSLERLRNALSKSGVTVSAAGLAGTLSVNAVQAVPIGLAATITGSALAGAQATTAGFITWKFLAMTKLQFGMASVILIGSVVGAVLWRSEHHQAVRLQNAFQQQAAELGEVRAQNDELKVLLAEAGSTTPPDTELLRLRAQAAQLAQENLRLRSRLDQQAKTGSPAAGQPGGNASLDEILEVLRDQATTSEADSRRFDAAAKLKAMGTNALAGLPQFLELLHSGNQESAYAGARALSFSAGSNPELLQHLIDALSDGAPQVRDAATHGLSLQMTLGATNLDGASVLPLLLRNLQDSSQTVRADTAQALRAYIPWQKSLGRAADRETVIPSLARNLSDDWLYARANAAWALAEFGKEARETIPPLQTLLNDPHEQARMAAAAALQRIEAK